MEENKDIVTKIALKYVPDFKEEHRATYREVWEALMEMAKYKDKEFEDLINGLPTPIKELIKAFNNE